MSVPYMPLYVADYLGDTRHLTTEQHGAYLLLLMSMWRAGGELPDDHGKLARMCGLTAAKWSRVGADVLAFFERVDGLISHHRLTKELKNAQRTSDVRASSGRRGGAAKSRKTKETALANATVLPEQKAAISESESEEDSDANASVSDRAPTKVLKFTPTKAEIDAIWTAAPRLARERSSRKDVERSLTAAMRRGHEPDEIGRALMAAYASPSFQGDHARGIHRFIENDRWQSFTERIDAATPASDPARDAEILRRMIELADAKAANV